MRMPQVIAALGSGPSSLAQSSCAKCTVVPPPISLGRSVEGSSAAGRHEFALDADGVGGWRVDGAPAPHLDGCLDVDLESSSLTNALPVRRLGLGPGQASAAPAAYVRALDLSVERLEQRYARTDDGGNRERYDYTAPAFDFRCELVYDESGLVLEYPGIADRAA